MNGISNLWRGLPAILLLFTWPAVGQDERQNEIRNSQIAADMTTNRDYWAIEDAKERERLPLYKIIPAATPDELTPANGYPRPETFLTWHRSHGDNGGRRYSALDQINRQNVKNLQQA